MVQRARGRSITAIVAAPGRSKFTISRALKRNSDGNTCSASQARARYHRKRKLDDPEIFALVKDRFLKQHWSPEQKYRPRKCLQWRTPYQVYFEQPLHLV